MFKIAESITHIVRSVTLFHMHHYALFPLRHAVDLLGEPRRTDVRTPKSAFIEKWFRAYKAVAKPLPPNRRSLTSSCSRTRCRQRSSKFSCGLSNKRLTCTMPFYSKLTCNMNMLSWYIVKFHTVCYYNVKNKRDAVAC